MQYLCSTGIECMPEKLPIFPYLNANQTWKKIGVVFLEFILKLFEMFEAFMANILFVLFLSFVFNE